MQIVIKTLKGKQHPIDYEAETTVSFFLHFKLFNVEIFIAYCFKLPSFLSSFKIHLIYQEL